MATAQPHLMRDALFWVKKPSQTPYETVFGCWEAENCWLCLCYFSFFYQFSSSSSSLACLSWQCLKGVSVYQKSWFRLTGFSFRHCADRDIKKPIRVIIFVLHFHGSTLFLVLSHSRVHSKIRHISWHYSLFIIHWVSCHHETLAKSCDEVKKSTRSCDQLSSGVKRASRWIIF